MSRYRCRGRLALAVLLSLAAATSVFAIIEAPKPLAALLDSDYIVAAKVEKLTAEPPLLVLTVQDDLKGKAPFRRLAVNFRGDDEAKKRNHMPQLRKRLAAGLPLVLFIIEREKRYTAFAYTDGTWFQLIGQQTGDAGRVAWSLTHGEPYLRRTFKGSTAELRKLLVDGLAGKAKLPPVNKKEKPGFGPEVAPKDKSSSSEVNVEHSLRECFLASTRGASALHSLSGSGALFGVIPTLGVGAPLLVLAALFPAVFGGVLVLFRQWTAFITVFSLNSTLLLLHWLLNTYWPNLLRGTWIGSEAGLWFLMTLVALGGTVWAWRRQLAHQAQGELAVEAPRRTELTVLWSLTVLFVLVSVLTPLLSWSFTDRYDPRADLAWMSMLVLTLGVVAGTIYRTGRGDAGTQPALATEGVMIAAVLLGQVGYTGYRWGGEDLGPSGDPVVQAAAPPVAGAHGPRFERIRWQFTPKNLSGLVAARPLVDGDRVYVGAARPSFGQGTLFCLDRANGAPQWQFTGDGGDLKQMISGPIIAAGKLYMGEGFHNDPSCRLFCIDAAGGKLAWAFPTTGQTECSPCVASGKLYFGAGNDGIYCVDANKGAADGKPLWRFPPQPHPGRLLRCGATPAVLGNRLYSGSAVDRNQKDDPGETAIFCLDTDSGKPHWKKPVPLPTWSAPILSEGQAIYALGNGDVFSDGEGEAPAGLLLCVDAQTGDEVWRFAAPNGVLDSPAVDAHRVYFGCRDGYVYCVGRRDGKLRWKAALEAPVVASPILAGRAGVIAVGTGGKIACLNRGSGEAFWSVQLPGKELHFSATPRVVAAPADDGERRQIIVAGGVGGLFTGRPIVYCLEDFVRDE